MKQIKVIAENDASGNKIKDGIINISFNEPLTITSGSRIAIDKILITLRATDATFANADLSIELSSLELDSYDSSQRGRKNVICYFTPSPTADIAASKTYLFESKVMNFISINNEFDIDVGTLVFRVVNVKNKKGVDFDYCSFNVLLV